MTAINKHNSFACTEVSWSFTIYSSFFVLGTPVLLSPLPWVPTAGAALCLLCSYLVLGSTALEWLALMKLSKYDKTNKQKNSCVFFSSLFSCHQSCLDHETTSIPASVLTCFLKCVFLMHQACACPRMKHCTPSPLWLTSRQSNQPVPTAYCHTSTNATAFSSSENCRDWDMMTSNPLKTNTFT